MIARRLEGLGAILVQLALPDRFHNFFQLVGRMFPYLSQNVGVALKSLLFTLRLLIERKHIALVAYTNLQSLFKLPIFGFELCGFCRDDGQVSFVELTPSVVVLLQNFSGSLKRSRVALKLFLSVFKLLSFPFGVDLPALGYEFSLFSLVRP